MKQEPLFEGADPKPLPPVEEEVGPALRDRMEKESRFRPVCDACERGDFCEHTQPLGMSIEDSE